METCGNAKTVMGHRFLAKAMESVLIVMEPAMYGMTNAEAATAVGSVLPVGGAVGSMLKID
jgi:hypothetical protein